MFFLERNEAIFEKFCSAQAVFESSRHVYRREHKPGQVRRFFNVSFTSFELRRHMMSFYFLKGHFTITELVKVSEFSRPTVNSTLNDALELGFIEEIKISKDLRCRNFRPTQPMLEAWQNYCSALLKKPEFVNAFKLAQTLMLLEDI